MRQCNVIDMRFTLQCNRNVWKTLLIIQSTIILLNTFYHDKLMRFVFEPAYKQITSDPYENLQSFLVNYSEYCKNNLFPSDENLKVLNIDGRDPAERRLCPCLPDTLVGLTNVTSDDPPAIGELELRHQELRIGGQWYPTTCIPRQRIAVIVPFRDRELHLQSFLGVIHPFLQRQMLHYTIFVVEQVSPTVFNKAMLMNAGFLEAKMFAPFDCFIFHDVDLLPESDLNIYTCSEFPRHVGSHIDKFDYILPYEEIFGAVTAFNREQFELVNGFSNQYYGWGGEDDDMYYRILAKNLTIMRFPESVARYSMIKHSRDAGNPINIKRRDFLFDEHRIDTYATDGLNSVRYKVKSSEARPLYVWLGIELPPHPTYINEEFLLSLKSCSSNKLKNVYPYIIPLCAIFAAVLGRSFHFAHSVLGSMTTLNLFL